MLVRLIVGILLAGLVLPHTAAHAAAFKAGQWSLRMTPHFDTGARKEIEKKKTLLDMQSMSSEERSKMKRMLEDEEMQMNMDTPEEEPTIIVQCLTPGNPIPEMPQGGSRTCRETHRIKGHTVKFYVVCKEPANDVDATGEMTFKGEGVKGKIQMSQNTGDKIIHATIDVSGKYLGPCHGVKR